MTEGWKNKCLAVLRELESSHHIVDRLEIFGSSSWVLLKNFIFERSLDHLVSSKVARIPSLSWMMIRLIGIGLYNYLVQILHIKPRNLFVGAGSGVFLYKGELLDSYLPSELSSSLGTPTEDTIYMLSANHVDVMWEQRGYLQRHRAIVYSFLIAPLRLVLGRLLSCFLPLNRRLVMAAHEISSRVGDIGLIITPQEILRLHARFCVGYLLYRLLLLPFRINRAFVVSAYSNSELCAVLRRIGVEIIEVQHGLIGPTHRGYNYATQNSLLPAPNKVMVYDTFWQDELLAAGYFSRNQIIIGQRLKYLLAEQEVSPFDFPYVVLTGQGILKEQIAHFVADFARSKSHLHLVYIPHPTEDLEYIKSIKTSTEGHPRIHIIENRKTTTERLIMDSVAHLSIYSSCHFDAIHYKGRTFLLDILDNNLMYYYARLYPDTVVLVKDSFELINFLEHDV